jgi:hypothetical protein
MTQKWLLVSQNLALAPNIDWTALALYGLSLPAVWPLSRREAEIARSDRARGLPLQFVGERDCFGLGFRIGLATAARSFVACLVMMALGADLMQRGSPPPQPPGGDHVCISDIPGTARFLSLLALQGVPSPLLQ